MLYLDGNMAEAGQFENTSILGVCRPWQGYKEQGQGNGRGTFRRPTSG
jgi:hypothetical protein